MRGVLKLSVVVGRLEHMFDNILEVETDMVFDASPEEDLDMIGWYDLDKALEVAKADPDCDPIAYGAIHVDEIQACERLIRFAQERQAELVDRLYKDRTAIKATRREFIATDAQIAQSVCAEVAMARQISMSSAQTQFGFGAGLSRLPLIKDLFGQGLISERLAKIVVNETSGLSYEDSLRVDNEIAWQVTEMTIKQAAALTRSVVMTFDTHAAEVTARRARDDRFVTLTPLDHAMASINIRTGADQAVAMFKALDVHARGVEAGGDDRTVGQIMVDTAFTWITGHKSMADVPIEVHLVMTPDALFGADDAPARLEDYGPIPASLARQLSADSRTWLRRLFTDPIDHTALQLDPKRRRFDGRLARLINAQDQQCRRPFCDCRIRHKDHIEPFDGTNTVRSNGQGLCQRSHTTKHLPGFKVSAQDDGSIRWITPTGHSYTSRRPPVLDQLTTKPVPRTEPSYVEIDLRKMLFVHRQSRAH